MKNSNKSQETKAIHHQAAIPFVFQKVIYSNNNKYKKQFCIFCEKIINYRIDKHYRLDHKTEERVKD